MRLLRILRFVAVYVVDLVRANALVAWEVATPTHHMSPGIVAVPVRVRGARLSLLANLITLTPGTITLDLDEDESVIYVHSLHLVTPEQLRSRVEALEDRVLEVTT